MPTTALDFCDHEQRLVVIDLHFAPVPQGHHTHVMVFGCHECQRAWCWPPDNYRLVTQEFREALRLVLAGQRLQLVGAVPANGQLPLPEVPRA